MAGAYVDPDELRNFAHALTHFNDTLENASGQLSGHFSQLGQSWQDQKQKQFEDTFSELIHTLAKFREISAEQVNYLHHLAGVIDQYNNS
ncbi:MAG: WXG100 family type VII secretion target [Treponema sp.]|jgi:uncharacterized protein YukE|nr:WXG100 family type VII secretion target [Treponema sp.]